MSTEQNGAAEENPKRTEIVFHDSVIQAEWEKYRNTVFVGQKPSETSNEKLHWLAGALVGLYLAEESVRNNEAAIVLNEQVAQAIRNLSIETRKIQLRIAETLIGKKN